MLTFYVQTIIIRRSIPSWKLLFLSCKAQLSSYVKAEMVRVLRGMRTFCKYPTQWLHMEVFIATNVI